VFQVFFHGSGFESLYEHVPRDALPREYGGQLDSVQQLTGELASLETVQSPQIENGVFDACPGYQRRQ
jgi:hypothetical protein